MRQLRKFDRFGIATLILFIFTNWKKLRTNIYKRKLLLSKIIPTDSCLNRTWEHITKDVFKKIINRDIEQKKVPQWLLLKYKIWLTKPFD